MAINKKLLGYGATSGTSIFEVLESLEQLQLNVAEINLNVPTFQPEKYSNNDLDNIIYIKEEKNITLTFHGPEDITLLTPHREFLDGGIKRIGKLMEFASILDGKRFTMHTGSSIYFTETSGKNYLHLAYSNEYKDYFRYGLESLLNLSYKNKIPLCIENEGIFDTIVIQPVLQEYLDNDNLYLTWDIGHSAIAENMRIFMESNLRKVKNVHLHDHDGNKDHRIIGMGKLDFKHYIGLLDNLDSYFILEIRPKDGVIPSIKYLEREGLLI